MTKLVLASEGVFPIIKDEKGELIKDTPKTGLPVSGTIQGEGKLAGITSLFIRLSSCNLRCMWQMEDGSYCRCDTAYASFHPNKTKELTVEQIVALVKNNLGPIKHVVITGGEPLRQKKALATLCKQLKTELDIHLTMESNGSMFDEEVAKWIDLFSISPKLSNSNPTPAKLVHYQLEETAPLREHANNRVNIEALQAYINLSNATNKQLQFKFVAGRTEDAREIKKEFLNRLTNWKSEDILIMPLGATQEELAKSTPLVLDLAVRNGWRFTPRIHIDLFGSKTGV
ncbi:7-carboxy-7-deazaguanine synthase QueE [Marinilabiliaceae bacterium JC017]|nr:7-carboxy-7-deazaguanine synthase QueE [Marinilabiliaceae bacterium JC017]